ncbi:MAG TPA: ABC transporter ATP-binding protein [Ktedonosporobacter sp.]|jgi:ATP-binding cassette subfamily B protein|nr:ABC transporter ATP-binding protein [Ktedonosporobacter sp.]
MRKLFRGSQISVSLQQAKTLSLDWLDALKLNWYLAPLSFVVTMSRNIIVGLIPAANAWLLRTVLLMVVAHASFLLLLLLTTGLVATSLFQSLEMQHLDGYSQRKSSLFVIRKLLAVLRSWPVIKFEEEERVTRLTRIRRDSTCLSAIATATGKLLGATTVFLSFLGILWHISPSIALLGVIIGVPVIVVAARVSALEFSVEEKQAKRQRFADYLASIISVPRLAKETKVFQSGTFLLKEWYELSSALIREALSASFKVTILEVLTLAAGLAIFSWFLFQLIGLVETRQLSSALFIALIPFAISLLQTMDEARLATKSLVKGLYSWNRCKEVLATESRKGQQPVRQQRVLREGALHVQLQSVSFRYPGGAERCLEDVTLEVVPGETLALVGVNGSGKTTLAQLIAGIYEPECGSVIYNNVSLQQVSHAERARRIAFVFQSPIKYPASTLENISSFRSLESETLSQLYDRIQILQLSPTINHLKLSMGYSDGTDISGGQWQKIALARALVDTRASLFLLDEPTASLDPETEVEVFRLFRRLTQGSTRIIISHRLGFAKEADRIAVLDHGKLREVGSHQQLIEHDDLYAQMYAAQSAWYAGKG